MIVEVVVTSGTGSAVLPALPASLAWHPTAPSNTLEMGWLMVLFPSLFRPASLFLSTTTVVGVQVVVHLESRWSLLPRSLASLSFA